MSDDQESLFHDSELRELRREHEDRAIDRTDTEDEDTEDEILQGVIRGENDQHGNPIPQ